MLFLLSKLRFSRALADETATAGQSGQSQIDLDKKLVYSLAKTRIPSLGQLKYLSKFLSTRERWLLRASLALIILSIIFSVTRFYQTHREVVPVRSGLYVEALVGAPKYINPLYSAVSDIDQDISRLVYSSLFTRGENGELINDLAASYEIGDEGKTYFFILKDHIFWHDGSPLTVDDVIFTFNAIKDKQYKSPLRTSFNGVVIEKTDNGFKFVLTDPYAAFLDLLTFGIIPSVLWEQISPESVSLAELNIKPVGSGPYKFDKLVKDKSGNIKEYYLKINENYYGRQPYLDIGFKFYASFEEAIAMMNEKAVDGISYLPRELESDLVTPKSFNFHKLRLPQLTAIFFNQGRNPALADKTVRQALARAINREAIINGVLGGDAYAVNGPIPEQSFAYHEDLKTYEYNENEAMAELENAGWKSVVITADEISPAETNGDGQDAENLADGDSASAEDDEAEKKEIGEKARMGEGEWRQKDGQYLIVKLTTVDRTENARIIEAVKEYWERIGVKTEIELIPTNQVQSGLIVPRNFEALFYGQIIGADPDPYAFWHSTQVGESGLNMANFSNKEVDQLLEDARLSSNQDERREKYKRFQDIIAEEVPAIYLYSSAYNYAQNKEVKGFEVNNLYYPSDRFANIAEWYMKTGKKLIW